MKTMQPVPNLHSRILIVEHHELVAEGLKQLLEPEFEIAGIFANYLDMVRHALALEPDVVLCNISRLLPEVLQAAKAVKKALSEVKIIYLSVNYDPNLAIAAFDSGCASGYLLKTCSVSELTIAIRTVLKGLSYVSLSLRDVVNRLRWERRKGVDELERLTQRQREVLRLLTEGNTMRAAGSALGLKPRTIAFHKYEIMKRLSASSNGDLVKFAVRNHLLAEEKARPLAESLAELEVQGMLEERQMVSVGGENGPMAAHSPSASAAA